MRGHSILGAGVTGADEQFGSSGTGTKLLIAWSLGRLVPVPELLILNPFDWYSGTVNYGSEVTSCIA